MLEYGVTSELLRLLVAQGLGAGLAGTGRASGKAPGERITAAHPEIGSGEEGQSVPMRINGAGRFSPASVEDGEPFEPSPNERPASLRIVADSKDGRRQTQRIAPRRLRPSLMLVIGGKP